MLCSCSFLGIENSQPEVDKEPSFSEDPLYNITRMIEEGWDVKIENGQLVFERETETGIEIYKPKK
jgi:hypothetical protein